MLAEKPGIGFAARQPGTVYARLLPSANAYHLAVIGVADGIGLRVFEGDEGDDHVAASSAGKLLVGCDDFSQAGWRRHNLIALLAECHAKHVAGFRSGWLIIGVDLDDAVAALLFLLQDFQGLWLITRGNDAIGNLTG